VISLSDPLIPAKAGTQAGARRFTTKDTKDTKARFARGQSPSRAVDDIWRALGAPFVCFVSLVVQFHIGACLGPGFRRDERILGVR
jgi:hypothetical protein